MAGNPFHFSRIRWARGSPFRCWHIAAQERKLYQICR